MFLRVQRARVYANAQALSVSFSDRVVLFSVHARLVDASRGEPVPRRFRLLHSARPHHQPRPLWTRVWYGIDTTMKSRVRLHYGGDSRE